MRHLLFCLGLLAACGGGSGGDNDPAGGGPPGPAYANTTSSGLAVGPSFGGAAAIGADVVAAVSETEMGADLNGDGDRLDLVVHLTDTATNTSTNLGIAIVGPVIASDKQFAFLALEPGQNNTDLNGDGDSADGVWFVYDPARPLNLGANPRNTMIPAHATGMPGVGTRGGFVLMQAEVAANADLNGDGDMIDEIPVAFDGGAFAVSPLVMPAHASATPLISRNARVLLASSEAAAALDQNGDGDMTDVVLGVVDFTQGFAQLQLVGGAFGRAVANHPYALTDDSAVYFIDEATHNGTDLNNDTDALDAIIAIFDLKSGAGEATPMNPLLPSFAVAGATLVGIGAGPNRVIVAVSEMDQGMRDINGDFDTVDSILGWIDTGTPGTLHMLPTFTLGAVTPAIDGPRGLVTVSERAMTFLGQDLNGDGDSSDNVAYMLDTTSAPGVMNNVGVAVGGFSLQGDDALLGVDEASDKGIDRNGDSVADDIVQAYCDLSAAPFGMRSLAIVAASQTFFRLSQSELRIAARLAEGQSPTFGDLNADGDLNDFGLELITLDPTGAPPTLIAPTPFFAGTDSIGGAPPLRVGNDTFAFATSEAMSGKDLNADGDRGDTVLQFAKIN